METFGYPMALAITFSYGTASLLAELWPLSSTPTRLMWALSVGAFIGFVALRNKAREEEVDKDEFKHEKQRYRL